jgi:hypothetical protein
VQIDCSDLLDDFKEAVGLLPASQSRR